MNLPSVFRLLRTRGVKRLVLAVVVAEVVVTAGIYAVERVWLTATAADVTVGKDRPGVIWRKMDAAGLDRPPALPARTAGLDDDELVIGVVVGNRARAYRLSALKYPPWHLVNDMLGNVPVSVTYCDMSDCTHVYTSRHTSAPLDVVQAGLRNHKMVVKLRGIDYIHETETPVDPGPHAPVFPYEHLPWERTTWKAWVRQHPDTDVFVGKTVEDANPPASPTSPAPRSLAKVPG